MSPAKAGNRIPPSTDGHRGGRPTDRRVAALALALAAVSACGAPGRTPVEPGPRPPAPGLPPIPAVDGPLELRVSYPRDSLALTTRGPTFIFGSAGSGRARVWVNGRQVEVQPNGGFLAFLPVPEDSVYRLRATLDGATQTLEVPVSLPPAPPEPGDSAVIVDGSLYPAGAWVAQPGETIEVGFVGTAAGDAWLELGDEWVPLHASADPTGGASDFVAAPGPGDPVGPGGPPQVIPYRGFFPARRIVSPDPAVPWPTLTGEPAPARRPAFAPRPDAGTRHARGSIATVVLATGVDTVRKPLPVNLLLADPDRPRVGTGRDLDPPARNGDARIVGRPGPGGGPYHYVWANGVELELTGERAGAYRVRLTDDLHAWTSVRDVQLLARGTPPPTSRVPVVRLDPQPGHVDVYIGLDRRLPYRIEETKGSVGVVVYGAVSRVNFLQHGRVDPYIERAEWSQPTDRTFRVDVRLAGPTWGYEAFWGPGDDLVLRLKRPPALDLARPLQGLTVGVDAGHGGADTLTMGPTGLSEADANLGVARALRSELERRGATVVMSRMSDTTVSLVERTRLARRRDVDVWISVHNNAFPDGVDPWANHGTSVYYTHPRAASLAWSVQEALLEELGVRDLGVGRADLHQPRFTWAPAILTETLFMMIPSHEAFLKTEAGRRRIALAHVRGLETWLREVAAGGTSRGPER